MKFDLHKVGGIVLIWTAGTAWAGEVPTLVLPCINATAPDEILRQKTSGKHAGQRLCQDYVDQNRDPKLGVVNETLKQLKARIQKDADCFYRGVQFDPLALPQDGQCHGAPVPREVCNAVSDISVNGVPGTFNGEIKETDNNHFGSGCGDWPYFSASLSGTVCSITPNYTLTTRFIEDSFNRGAWIQALNCSHAQVVNEIKNSLLLKISSIKKVDPDTLAESEVEGPCRALSRDYVQSAAAVDVKADQVFAEKIYSEAEGSREKNLATTRNLADIEFCTGKEVTNGTNGAAFNAGPQRQSACQLVASRTALESAFTQVAACEIFTRAKRSYEQFLGSSVTGDEITKNARAAINGITVVGRANCAHGPILENHYKPKYFGFLNDKANSIWNSETCK